MKIILEATAEDAALANALDPPMRGCQAGAGIHIEIPEDWRERILRGEAVEGCSYASIERDGSLVVSGAAHRGARDPEIVALLPEAQRDQVADFLARITDDVLEAAPEPSAAKKIPVQKARPRRGTKRIPP